jgi:hypothetical protein
MTKATLFAFCLLMSQTVWADSIFGFGKEQTMTLDEFRPRLHDNEGYFEEWSAGVYMPDGSYLGADFIISNIGFGDHNGAVKVRYQFPPGTGKKDVTCASKYDDDEWSWKRTGPFGLTYGKNRIHGNLKTIKVSVRCDNMHFDLVFTNEAAPLKPGGGTLRFGRLGQYSMNFPSPRSSAKGTLTMAGKTLALQGTGHISHSRTTMYPQDHVKRWFRFKHIAEDVSIIIAELKSEKPFFYARKGWVLILDSSGRILASGETHFQYDGFIKDEKSEQGYRIPRRVKFSAVDGDSTVQGTLIMTGVKRISDPLASLGVIVRAFVKRYTKPREYRLFCTYDIKQAKGEQSHTYQGRGEYQVVHINP